LPCNETINADGTADLLTKTVFAIYEIPRKIISDRGPQFASRVMKAVLKAMGIKSALSTAYHPQTDGATEWANQEIEQFSRAYCNRTQNNWAQLLPYAAWTHNTRTHSATKRTPYKLLFRVTPVWPHQINNRIEIPAAEEIIKIMQESWKEAEAAIKLAQEATKQQQEKYGDNGPIWKEGAGLVERI
jgi:hypothetical protein